jgi:hypothetical protein
MTHFAHMYTTGVLMAAFDVPIPLLHVQEEWKLLHQGLVTSLKAADGDTAVLLYTLARKRGGERCIIGVTSI